MKSMFWASFALFLLAPALLFGQKNNKPAAKEADVPKVFVSKEVLETAEWAKFDYTDKVKKAEKGDVQSLKALLEFNNALEGKVAVQHALTCLELFPSFADDQVGALITGLKPKLKPLLLARLQEAQKLAQKENLQKPMAEWAPLSLKALNGERVVCASCMHVQGEGLSAPPQKPGAMSTPMDKQDSEKQ